MGENSLGILQNALTRRWVSCHVSQSREGIVHQMDGDGGPDTPPMMAHKSKEDTHYKSVRHLRQSGGGKFKRMILQVLETKEN